MKESRVVVALDFATVEECERFLVPISPSQCAIKIGKELFVAGGPDFVRRVVDRGFRVFLDLKFHDIPNTVASACKVAARLGVWMLDVHASGGRAMLAAAREAIEGFPNRPRLLAVTVLTSMGNDDLREVGVEGPVIDQVRRLAALAADCGSDGVVCSAQEASVLRAAHPEPFLLVTPGIRLSGGPEGDQVRVVTPRNAIAAGASHLVVGRPITRAVSPLEVLQKINFEIESGMESK